MRKGQDGLRREQEESRGGLMSGERKGVERKLEEYYL